MKYITGFIFLFALYDTKNLSAQQTITGLLVNSKTLLPVPYATIKVLHSSHGSYSDENGKFELPMNDKDTLAISSIGFQPVKTTINITTDTIFLKPFISELPTVIVGQKKFLNHAVFGITNGKPDLNWGPSGYGEEFAQLIHLRRKDNELIKVNKVILVARDFNPTTPVVLHIYSVGENGLPGDDLLQTRYLISAKNFKRKKVIVDITSEDFFIDENRIFVGFEFLGRTGVKQKRPNLRHTTVQLTFSLQDAFTYSRFLGHPHYNWFPCNFSSRQTDFPRNANTMFSIEVEYYK